MWIHSTYIHVHAHAYLCRILARTDAHACSIRALNSDPFARNPREKQSACSSKILTLRINNSIYVNEPMPCNRLIPKNSYIAHKQFNLRERTHTVISARTNIHMQILKCVYKYIRVCLDIQGIYTCIRGTCT